MYVQNHAVPTDLCLSGAKSLAAFANSGSLGEPKPLDSKEERLLKEAEQKQEKTYKRKGHRKEVLFKDDEWEIIKAKAAKMNLSTTRYIVKISLNGDTVPQDFIGFKELSRQLSLIGNNLNQLARKANTINNIYAEDYERMREEYAHLCLLLKQKISMLCRTAA